MKNPLFLASVALATALAAAPSKATDLYAPASGCTDINCSGLIINGTVNPYTNGAFQFPGVAVYKVWGSFGGQCMRLEVTNDFGASPDLEMTVISPNPSTAYRNDQGGGPCINCPIVKVQNTQNGYYTVVLHSWTGGLVATDFQLRYGLYSPATNPNCSGPTTPFVGSEAAK
jgi:hypothetical protein